MLRQLLTRQNTRENRDDMLERDWKLLEPHLKRAGYRLRTFRDIRDAVAGEFDATHGQEELPEELLDWVAPSRVSSNYPKYRLSLNCVDPVEHHPIRLSRRRSRHLQVLQEYEAFS